MKKLKELDQLANKTNKISIYAAALQDHYIKKQEFNILIPKTNVRRDKIKKVEPMAKKIITKDEGSKINESIQKKDSKIQSNLFLVEYEKKRLDIENEEKKKTISKIKNYMNKLTLAQRLGLKEKPEKPLSNEDWKYIEEKGKNRVTECPICLEEFKSPHNQVILSCSHIFHKTCLTNFEKFSKSKVCPLCRREDYEKKNFDYGFISYINEKVEKIQKIFRGYITRKKYYNEWNSNYRAQSALLKRRLLAHKLKMLGEKMERRVKDKQKHTNKILEEIDKNMIENQLIFEQFESKHRVHHNNLNNLKKTFLLDQNQNQEIYNKEKWDVVLKQAILRDEKNCAICINELEKNKNICLLSCSHVFHENCLQAFEYYNIYSSPTCPVCRSQYTRVPIHIGDKM